MKLLMDARVEIVGQALPPANRKSLPVDFRSRLGYSSEVLTYQ
jgi:hypothetical protein